MAMGTMDLLTAMQNGVNAIRDLTTTVRSVFPQSGTVTAITPSSSLATTTFLSSQSQGFLSVTTSSGGVYSIPVY